MAKQKKPKSELEKLVHHRQELYKTLDISNDNYDEQRRIIDEINKDIMRLSREKASELADQVDEKTKEIIKKRKAIEQELKDIKENNIEIKETISNSKVEKLIIILLSHKKYDTISKVIKVLEKHTDDPVETLQDMVERFIKNIQKQKSKQSQQYDWNDVKFLLTKHKEE